MKCNNCGAETKGKVCEYCGCEMPEEKTPVNITNNYYGATSELASNSENNSVGSKCPKCGGSNISFRREKTGTSAKSYNKRYKSQSLYRTIGICQDCGHTWSPSGDKEANERKTWLWVLGWIFAFPVPLTILLLKKKDGKPIIKYSAIAVVWIFYLIIVFAGGGSAPNQDITEDYQQQEIVLNTEEVTELQNVVDDKVVNKFLSECEFDYGEIDNGNIRTKFFVHINGCRTELLNSNTDELIITINGYHIDNINEEQVLAAFYMVAQTINENSYDTELKEIINELSIHKTEVYEGSIGALNYKFHPFVEFSGGGVSESRIEISTVKYNAV